MENKFTSFAYEEERSTYTEGESRSKRSSILKPPKARAPLQEVNLGGSADETGDFDTLRKRRVSFAGVNSVKEFCSNAESAQVCHIQSYEETFSTSSDNSHNSSGAKSQLGTPKNVSSTEDKNFVDDPMELTDSIIDNNHIGSSSSAHVVRVEPVLTANALSEESGFLRDPQGQTWNARKSALEHEEGQSWNARSSRGPNWSSGVEGYSVSRETEHLGAVARKTQPEESAGPHWSCTMEMTEPVHLKKSESAAQQSDAPFHFGRNSIKPESDSGMELTEAVGKMPNFLVDDNFGDASMEMTDVVSRGRKSVGFASSSNKSASMEFTEVVRKSQAPFTFSQSPLSGMELTEPIVAPHHPMAPHHEPMARHSLFGPVEDGKPKPRVSYTCTPGKTAAQSPGNKSSSDMEMTGVLSLSRASRLVANQEAEDDMDFTQIIMPSMPLRKKSRLSAEDDDDPFPIGRRLDAADKENLKLPLVELSVSAGPEIEHVVVSEKNVVKPAEDGDDTLALNFNNVKRGNSPVELSFLKEFKDSSPVSVPPGKSQIDVYSSKKPLQYDVPDEHLLLFSLSTTEDVRTAGVSEPKETGKEPDFDSMASPESEIPSVERPSAPINEDRPVSSKPELFQEDDFLVRAKGHRTDVDQMRGVRKSAGAENDIPQMRMSFKDFEIKADLTTTVMMHASLSTVGLDDSNILKAGFNDLTYPLEQVPACTSQLDITARTPRPSAPANTTLGRSMMMTNATGLDSIAENPPDRPGITGTVTRKSENVQDPVREEDNTKHTMFSTHMPGYKSFPDKSDTKHSQSFPTLDLEPTEVATNHVDVTDASQLRRSMGPGVPGKSMLPQTLPESCSMELTHVLNEKSIPAGRPSLNPMRAKVDYTDMELAKSISTEETLLRKSLPSVRADEASPERPSSMDETNLIEPVSQDLPKVYQPAHNAPLSVTSQETVCKSNMTICAAELIDTDSADAMDTEETFAKSKTVPGAVPSQFMDAAPSVPRLSQPRKSHFFPGMSSREETAPSELTDNHLINAGLNSTFSFHNFGGKGSSENVLEPLRKSVPAFGSNAVDFDDDASQTADRFFASRRVQDSRVPLRGVELGELMIGSDAKETSAFDNQPKSQTRMPRKSHFFGNLEEHTAPVDEKSTVGPHRSSKPEVTGKLASPKHDRKSAGILVEEVASHVSRKSIRVIPIFSAESSENLPQKIPEYEAQNPNCNRRSMGLSAQEQRKSGFTDLVGENGSPERPILGRGLDRKSVGLFVEKGDSEVARNPVKIVQDEMGYANQYSHKIVDDADHHRNSVGFPQENAQVPRKSIKVTPNFSCFGSSQPSEESLARSIDERIARKSTNQEVDSQAAEKSVGAGFSAENGQLIANSECAEDSALPPKSVGFLGQEVDGQVLRKSVRVVPAFNEESIVVPQQGVPADVGDVASPQDSHSKDEESTEPPVELPKRAPRKSCIGVQMDSSAETAEDNRRQISLADVSEEFEFAIKRNKRKSAVGVKNHDADSDKEVDSGIKVSHDDVHQGWSTDDDHKMSPDGGPDDQLSQGMMNVSINEEDMNEGDFSDDERMHVSTPCKSRLSSRLRDDGRKRSLKPDTRSTSDDGGVHDLSQDLMNVSLESDARSPMLKKSCASPQVRLSAKPNSARKSLAPISPVAGRKSSATQGSPPADRLGAARKSLVPPKSPPAARSSSVRTSLAPQKSLFEQRALAPSGSAAPSSAWNYESVMAENNYANEWGLSHDIRVKNRDFMAAKGFTHLNRQIYEIWLFAEVIGLRATFPNCEISEETSVIGVAYTIKGWKLGKASCSFHEDVFEFCKNRLLEALPEKQLKCRSARDLFRVATDLKKLESDLKPLIERMTFLKLRYPCEINKDNIEFLILDARYMLKFAVKIDLRSGCLGEDSVSVTNLRGQVKEHLVKLMFRVLTPGKDLFYTFVKELRNNTERLVAR